MTTPVHIGEGWRTSCTLHISSLSDKVYTSENSVFGIMMEPSCSGLHKRKIKDLDDEPVTNNKQICVNTSDNALYYQETQGLMCLPDEVLYIILGNLHPRDRLQISLTCQRMFDLVGSPVLWRDVDCRPFHINHSMFKRIIKFLSIRTVSLSISGCENIGSNDAQSTCSRKLLKKIKQMCTNLKTLRLEDDRICRIKIKDLPQTLEELSFGGCSGCCFSVKSPFFSQINELLPNVTKLCLRDCRWLDPKALVVISKMPNLCNLDLSECTLEDCFPYFRTAVKYGFQKLQVLDLRRSLVGDDEVSSLKALRCLTDLLLQSPSQHDNRPNVQPARREEDREGDQDTEEEEDTEGEEDEEGEEPEVDNIVVVRHDNHFNLPTVPPYRRVTDLGISEFGRIEFRLFAFQGRESLLERLVLRDYILITNITLHHLSHATPHLKYLDVRGTRVNRSGVQVFKRVRPDCTIVSDFD